MFLRVDHRALTATALKNLIEEFVTRDGTDYGEHEASLQTKLSQVQAKLKTGELFIIFNEADNSCNIISSTDFPELN